MPHDPELLAPAGGWECLRAAVANGADAKKQGDRYQVYPDSQTYEKILNNLR